MKAELAESVSARAADQKIAEVREEMCMEEMERLQSEISAQVDRELERLIPPIIYDSSGDMSTFVNHYRGMMLRQAPPPTFPVAELDDVAGEAPTTPWVA